MKVLIVSPSYLPATRYGGTIYSVHGLAKGLIANGVDVDVITTSVDGSRNSDVEHGRWVDVDGVNVRYCLSSGILRRVYYARTMKTYLHQHAADYDLIHAHAAFLWPNSYAYRAARRAGVPFVWSPRGMLVKRLFSSKSAWFKWPWWWLFGRKLVANSRIVHCTSDDERAEIAAFGVVANTEVIPNGVEVPHDPRVARDGKRIIYVGRISWKKRLDVLIEALAPLLQSGYVLDIVGNDEEALTPRLQQCAHSLRVSDSVRFSGALSPAQRDARLWQSAVLCLVSEQENFGNVVLEAMACATPVVVTEGCGVSEVVAAEDAGMVCTSDVLAIRGAVQNILENSDVAQSVDANNMGTRGRAAVIARYSWQTIGVQMHDAYAKCLE